MVQPFKKQAESTTFYNSQKILYCTKKSATFGESSPTVLKIC